MRRVAGEREAGGGTPRAGRAVLAALAACGLLAVVAAGSLHGPLGAGGGRARFPLELVETLGLLAGLAVVAAAVLLALALRPGRRERSPRAFWHGLLASLLPLLLLVGAWLARGPHGWPWQRSGPPTSLPAAAPPPPRRRGGRTSARG